jgi:hypothetical protein
MSNGEQELRDHFWNDPLSMVQFCEDTVLGALQFEKMPKPDRDKLVFADKQLRPAVEAIMNSLREILDEQQTKLAKDSLRDAIFAAFLIGKFSDATKSAEIFIQVKKAKGPRPGGVSPFTDFFKKELQRGLSATDIKAKLINSARNETGIFALIDDQTIEAVKTQDCKSSVKVERIHKMKISAIDGAISKAKKKIR